MEMQGVPVRKTLHEACAIGSDWQMPSMQVY